MTILIRDDEGLGNALMMDGYTDRQVSDACLAIRRQMREAAVLVFSDLLDRDLPETIQVHLAQDVRDLYGGTGIVTMASFDAGHSRDGLLDFRIHESSVKQFLQGDDAAIAAFRSTVLHEMIHAADLPGLTRIDGLLDQIGDRVEVLYGNPFDRGPVCSQVALLKILDMFSHYRAEGIAILGEHLLSGTPFPYAGDAFALFHHAYGVALLNAFQWVNGNENHSSDEKSTLVHRLAYCSAPVVLAGVMHVRGDLDESASQAVLDGLKKGGRVLSGGQLRSVFRSMLSLGLHEYMRGIMSLGDDVAPMGPLFELCARLQEDLDRDNIDAFIDLLHSDDLPGAFRRTMETVMGSFIPEEELDGYFRDFRTAREPLVSPEMMDKTAQLYAVLKDSADPESRDIARWALTYLFDDQDLIHDDIPGLGLVDDLYVVDCALEMIRDLRDMPAER